MSHPAMIDLKDGPDAVHLTFRPQSHDPTRTSRKISDEKHQSMYLQIGSRHYHIMIDGPETVQLTLIMLQTKTQIT